MRLDGAAPLLDTAVALCAARTPTVPITHYTVNRAWIHVAKDLGLQQRARCPAFRGGHHLTLARFGATTLKRESQRL